MPANRRDGQKFIVVVANDRVWIVCPDTLRRWVFKFSRMDGKEIFRYKSGNTFHIKHLTKDSGETFDSDPDQYLELAQNIMAQFEGGDPLAPTLGTKQHPSSAQGAQEGT